ncbi:MAG TPA: TetR/AcrR family transcriptional regulator, partial [Limnochordia bacterium]
MNEKRTRRDEQAAQRRTQLIETALEVFARKGVKAATIKDLAAAAGVAEGLLYHYFDSKDDLLRHALDHRYFLPALSRIAVPDRERPAREALLEVAMGFAAVLRDHRDVVQVMMQEAPSNPLVAERLERSRVEAVRLLSQYLDSRVRAGELRPHDTVTAARLLFFAVFTAHLTDTPPEP